MPSKASYNKTAKSSNSKKTKKAQKSQSSSSRSGTRSSIKSKSVSRSSSKSKSSSSSSNSKPVYISSKGFMSNFQNQEKDTCFELTHKDLNAYVRIKKELPVDITTEFYFLPDDINDFTKNTNKGPVSFLYLYGFKTGKGPFVGLLRMNPNDFLNGHTVCAKFMEERLGNTHFNAVLSGHLIVNDKTITMNDNSGHYYEYIYNKIILKYPNFNILSYFTEFILSNIVRIFPDYEIIFKSYVESGQLPHDNNNIETRFYKQLCNTDNNLNIYKDREDCNVEKDIIGLYCNRDEYSKYKQTKNDIVKAELKQYSKPTLTLLHNLYSNKELTNKDIRELYKGLFGKIVNIGPTTKGIYVNKIKKKYMKYNDIIGQMLKE